MTDHNTPTFRDALVIYLLSSMFLYTIGAYAQHLHLASGLLLSELAFVAAPAGIYALWKGYRIARVFSFAPIRLKTGLLALLISISAFFLVGILAAVQSRLFPHSETYQEGWNMVWQAFQQQPFALTILLVAVLPGICEEFLFRGFLLHGLRKRFSERDAIMLTGALFGLFHLDPYRLLPVSLLGILFGYLVVRTGSIFPAMIAHAANNGIAMVMMSLVGELQRQSGGDMPPFPSETQFPLSEFMTILPVIVVAVAVFLLGIHALPRVTHVNDAAATQPPELPRQTPDGSDQE